MPLDDLRIHLDQFDGPLDLLLHLIRRDELEIADIPIARVTKQYLDVLHRGGIDRIDIDQAGEFLVMAATLMEIKSRCLVPAEPGQENAPALFGPRDPNAEGPGAAPEDPRADLVRQLLAYKKFRDAARALEDRHTRWSSRFPGGGAMVPNAPAEEGEDAGPVEIEDLTLVDLAQAFASIMETVDFSRLGEHRVLDDETPIAVHAEDILDQLKRLEDELMSAAGDGAGESAAGAGQAAARTPPAVAFAKLFVGRTKSEAIGMFLALLELVRQRKVVAGHEGDRQRIVIRRTVAAEQV